MSDETETGRRPDDERRRSARRRRAVDRLARGRRQRRGLACEGPCRSLERAVVALGYSRNDFAHTLRTGSTRTIGVVVTRVSDPFFALVAAIEERAQRRDLLVMVASSGDDPVEERVMRRVLGRRLDGLIVGRP